MINCFSCRTLYRSLRIDYATTMVLILVWGCNKSSLTSQAGPEPPKTINAPVTPAPSDEEVLKDLADEDSLDLPLPDGSLIAQLPGDCQGQSNNHIDHAGTGKWLYLASPAPNPWDAGPMLAPLVKDAAFQGGPSFTFQSSNTGMALPRITLRKHSALMTPGFLQAPPFAVVRWISGVSGDIAIQGRFDLGRNGETAGGTIIVDGATQVHHRLNAQQNPSQTFSVGVSVLKGSTVDIVGNAFGGQLAANPLMRSVRTTIRIVQTSDFPTNLRAAPETVARIQETLRDNPVRKLPPDADISQSISRWQVRLDLWRSVFLDGFRERSHQNAQLIPQAEEFLEGYCLRISQSPKAPPIEQLVKSGVSLFDEGLEDPYVNVALAAVLFDSGQQQNVSFQRVLEAIEPMFESKQSPWLEARFQRLKTNLIIGAQADTNNVRTTAESRKQLARLVASLVNVAGNPKLTSVERRLLVELEEACSERWPRSEFRNYMTQLLVSDPATDEWVREIVLARDHHDLAWKARGAGFAHTVTTDQWEQFHIQIERARAHALRAWKLKPDLPEAAVELIKITMAAEGTAGEDVRFWFDEAAHADFAYAQAYTSYVWALRPRWGGSIPQMLAFARECLDTNRFDTEVPALFHKIVRDVAEELEGWEPAMRERNVYEGYVKLYQGLERQFPDGSGRNQRQSQLAAIAWLADKKPEARRLIAELGDRVDSQAFAAFGLVPIDVLRDLQSKSPSGVNVGYFADQTQRATALEFLPTGNQLVQGSDEGEIIVWDVESRKPLRVLKEHKATIVVLKLVDLGRRLISADRDGKINVWSVDGWTIVDTVTVSSPLLALAATPSGSRIAVSHFEDGQPTLDVVDVASKASQGRLPILSPPIGSLSWDEALERVYFSPPPPLDDQALSSWSLKDQQIRGNNESVQSGVTAWQLSPDGSRILAGIARVERVLSKSIAVFHLALLDAESGAILNQLHRLPGQVTAVAFSADGRHALATTKRGAIVQWSVESDVAFSCVQTGCRDLASLAASSDGSRISAIGSDGQVHVWSFAGHKRGWTIETALLDTVFADTVRSLAFTVDGKYLMVDAALSELSFWNWRSDQGKLKFAYHFPKPAYSLAVFPDKKRVLCQIAPGNLLINQIIDIATGETLDSPPRSSCIAVSPTGNYCALGGGDAKGIMLLDGADYHPLAWGILPGKDTRKITFASDGSALASLDRSGEVNWFDLPDNPTVNTSSPQPRFIRSRPGCRLILISPDKTYVACVHQGIEVINAQTGKTICEIPGTLAGFSPESKRIIVAGAPSTLPEATIYDVNTGKKVTSLRGGHRAGISALTFSPDGRFAFTADEEGRVRAWNATSGTVLAEFPLSEVAP